jgi:hypothetical protein
MEDTSRRPPEPWALVAAGIAWLAGAGALGAVAFALAVLPGALLLASGVAGVLRWDEPRARRLGALGALLGALLALPMLALAGGAVGLLLAALSAAAFAAAGSLSLRATPGVAGVPAPEPSLRLSAEVAADDAMLALFDLALPTPSEDEARRNAAELAEAERVLAAQGWLEKPASFHAAPPPFADVAERPRRSARVDFAHLRVASDFAPHPELPGAARWLALAPVRDAHAWLLRAADPARPWLVCIHGYRMGMPAIDLPVFRAARLRDRLGLNVLLPVLPLHGPRSVGRLSGDGFFSSDVLGMLHAETQAMWDLRRWLGWIRAQGGARVGAYGLSLGGYNAALLSGLDAELACVVAGIPATDLAGLVFEHGPAHLLRASERHGLTRELAERVLRVVSPLAVAPLPPAERRWIFGGSADQLVPAGHVARLVAHWPGAHTHWFEGAHLSFGQHESVTRQLAEALRGAGLT